MENKPLASFIIGFYNQEQFVEDAVNSALSQDYENLEIILSDDCSSDNSYEKIKTIINDYHGPHKIILNRNEKNLGISKHFNKLAYELSSGEYIIGGGGDDVSMPDRVSKTVGFLEKYKRIQSVTTYSIQVDRELNPISNKNNFLSLGDQSILTLEDYCTFKDFVIFSGDSRTYRRELLMKFPPLSESVEEDLEMFVRSIILGPIGVIREPLVKRRIHGNNVSKRASSLLARKHQYEQMQNDVAYAYEHNYINSIQKAALIGKIQSVRDLLIHVDNCRRHPKIMSILEHLSVAILKFGNKICVK